MSRLALVGVYHLLPMPAYLYAGFIELVRATDRRFVTTA
jgi:hypothetical protein